MDINDKYVGNLEYWNTLRSSFNNEVGNHFYTYICNLKELVSLDKIPKTDLKQEIINISSSLLEIRLFVIKSIMKTSINIY